MWTGPCECLHIMGFTHLLLIIASVCSLTQAQKPIGFWLFSDKYDTPYKDMSGNGHLATPVNITLDESQSTNIQNSAHFREGSSIYVTNNEGSLDVNSFTILIFIDPIAVIDEKMTLIAWKNEAGIGTEIFLDTDSKLNVRVVDNEGNLVNSVHLKGVVFGEWTLVAAAFNNRNGRLDIKVKDNYRKATDPASRNVTLSTKADLVFGSSENAPYKGHLNCAAVYGSYIDIATHDWSDVTKECFDPKVTCKELICGINQECAEIEGIAQCVCRSGLVSVKGVCKAPATCTVTGDPHGNSFDGRSNKFQGSCTYIQTQDACKNGAPTGEEPRFIVATKQWTREQDLKVSWVKEVIALIDGRYIELKQNGEVFLDDMKVPGLPVQVNDDVRVYDKPNYVFVETTFGLLIQWDRFFSVRITLTPEHSGKVCGMCGDYDENPDNDWIIGPNNHLCSFELHSNRTVGQKTKNTLSFGVSWMFGNDTSTECLDDCRIPPTVTPCTEERLKIAEDNCSALIDEEGPLEECIKALGDIRVKEIFKDCTFDECEVMTNFTAIVCGDGALMAEECSEAGVNIIWRDLHFCPLECPDHAFYTTCMTECMAQCGGEDNVCIPSGVCHEGCQCEEGYIASNGECIKPSQCGCLDPSTGVVIPIGATVVQDDCTKECTCEGHRQNLTCIDISCRSDQECRVVDGVQQCACPAGYGEIKKKCVPPAVCTCTGDPHCYSFDGKSFSYQGSCRYIMAQDGCNNGIPGDSPTFQVIVNSNRMKGKKLASRVNDVMVSFPLMNVTIHLHQGGLVTLNDVELTLPFGINNQLFIKDTPDTVRVVLVRALLLEWDRTFSVRVGVSGALYGQTCGMCGIYNGRSKDDLIMGPSRECMPDSVEYDPGTVLSDEVIMGSSWFHSKDDEKYCNDDCKRLPYPPKCSNKKAKKLCANLKKTNGPLGECLKKMSKVDRKVAYNNCLFDTCVMSEVTDKYACSAAELMAIQCKEQYGIIMDWRSDKFCPPPCPNHAKYLQCGPLCVSSCDDPEGNQCISSSEDQMCVAGCFCDEGYTFLDGECHPLAECKVPRKPCASQVHPETGQYYMARVECLTCKNAADEADCLAKGSMETCMMADAICEATTEMDGSKVVSVSRKCKARKDCTEHSIGEDLCRTKNGMKTCTQCNYGDPKKGFFRCQEWRNRDHCLLPKESGSGKKGSKVYYFNKGKCKCETFTYKPPSGNDNRFDTAEECAESCGNWIMPERCLEEVDKGDGKSSTRMYYYNIKKNKCKSFKYRGEKGTNNRFASKKECQQTCQACDH